MTMAKRNTKQISNPPTGGVTIHLLPGEHIFTSNVPWLRDEDLPYDPGWFLQTLRQHFERKVKPNLLELLSKGDHEKVCDCTFDAMVVSFMNGVECSNRARGEGRGKSKIRKETTTRRASEKQKDRWIKIYQAVRAEQPGWSQAEVIKATIKRVHKGQGKHTKISEYSLRDAFKARGLKME